MCLFCQIFYIYHTGPAGYAGFCMWGGVGVGLESIIGSVGWGGCGPDEDKCGLLRAPALKHSAGRGGCGLHMLYVGRVWAQISGPRRALICIPNLSVIGRMLDTLEVRTSLLDPKVYNTPPVDPLNM